MSSDKKAAFEVPSLASRIVYEDNHLLILNKLPGEISQADKTGDPSLTEVLKDFIKERDDKPGQVFLGLVHRLDRPTSGLLLFAKTSKALERLNEIFRERQVDKRYWALVEGIVPEDCKVWQKARHWITRKEAQNRSYASEDQRAGSQEAVLEWRLLKPGDRYSLLEVKLHTGRHHQIRAQLEALGFHIKGDLKYKAARSNKDGGISLHSTVLSFIHPVRKELLEVSAEPWQVQLADAGLWKALAPWPPEPVQS